MYKSQYISDIIRTNKILFDLSPSNTCVEGIFPKADITIKQFIVYQATFMLICSFYMRSLFKSLPHYKYIHSDQHVENLTIVK